MTLRDLFYVRKSDRQSMLALLVVAVVAVGVVWLTGRQSETSADGADTLNTDGGRQQVARRYYQVEGRRVELFRFDPNTADSTQLLRLGLQPWQVRNIYKYRAAGGIYRRKEDFARLYGLTVKQYRELEPYITISADYQPAAILVAASPYDDEPAVARHESFRRGDSLPHRAYQEKIALGETVGLNPLDTSEYKKVPGIGSYFARRIADYGRRLGGYASVDQLDEIVDFPASAKQYFDIGGQHVAKLHINRLSLDELKRHPYINYYQARAIVDYRRQQGPIRDLNELSLLDDFTDEAIRRLRPYVSYE